MGIRREPLQEILIRRGADPGRVTEAIATAEKGRVGFAEGLARIEGVNNEILVSSIAQVTGLPWLPEVKIDDIDVELVRTINLGHAQKNGVLPLWKRDGVVEVAIASPEALPALDDLRVLIGHPIQPVLLPQSVLIETINSAFERAAEDADAVINQMDDENNDEDDFTLPEDLVGGDSADQAPIIRYVNSVLHGAIKERASDIHIEPFEKDLSVRFRIDGVLFERYSPPRKFQASIISRVKIMAGLNIAEKRIPQDGRIRTRMAGRDIDIRVSTLPVRHGERVVMRILERGSVFSLGSVGMAEKTLKDFRKLIRLPHGIILVSGPTGSGKTTTLYSALSEINSPDKNILTIEDPVEYELRGIGQTQVNKKIDLSFARVIRAHLRQDPDIILVGETRDKETAENAIQASLTGHLVFSTIHTNDAATAFTRLVDMGIEPFLVASSLVAILAQRLVRRLCPHCKEVYQPTSEELRDVGLDPATFRDQLWRAVGCGECKNKGYAGRTGIYELLVVDDDIRHTVTSGGDAGMVKKKAVAKNMLTLRDDGLRKALAGETSLDEILRVTQEDAIVLD
ncbi:MAG: type II secretion system ATPase GspE [Myxococcota bacterium]|nr:type II secretion system ATPase GspE [Myxococcota bacterium]